MKVSVVEQKGVEANLVVNVEIYQRQSFSNRIKSNLLKIKSEPYNFSRI